MPYLSLEEVAQHLGVSKKTVYRLLEKKELPAVKVGRLWRFYRDDIEAWLKKEKPEAYVAEHIHDQASRDISRFLLSEAIKTGGIFFKISGDCVTEVIKNAVEIIPLGQRIDRKELAQAIIAREKLCTTAIGGGFALPHPRYPYNGFDYSRISLCFLENEVDFGALDKNPVDKLFFVFGRNEKEHLQLLKILVEMLQQPEFIQILETQASRPRILETIEQLEKRFQLQPVLA